MLTTPTKITKKQYAAGYIAINIETAEHFFLNPSENIAVYCGTDFGSLENSLEDEELERREEFLPDGVGSEDLKQCVIIPTNKGWNDLDLEALANGRIEWM